MQYKGLHNNMLTHVFLKQQILFSISLLLILFCLSYFDILLNIISTATSATIEQLKESVSKLKLPKEHTPRI